MAPHKFKRALRSAARFPVRVSVSKYHGGRSGANAFSPLPDELPVVLLRVQVLGCAGLVAKDRNGHSDPYVVVTVLNIRQHTPVAKRNVNPTYAPGDATWDYPLYLSLADKLGAVEVVVWDKDMVGKDYLGEVAISLDDWWGKEGKAFSWDDPANKPFSVNLQSTRENTAVSGTVNVKLGFVKPTQSQTELEFDEIIAELEKRSRPSLVSAPPTEGVGTIRSKHGEPELLRDDGGISSDEGDSDSDEEFADAAEERSSPSSTPPQGVYDPPQPPTLTIQPSSPFDTDSKTPTSSFSNVITPTLSTTVTPTGTPTNMPTVSPSGKAPSSPSFTKKIFPIPLPRRLSGFSSTTSSSTSSSSGALDTPAPVVPPSGPLIDPISGTLMPGTPASAPERDVPSPLPTSEGGKKRFFSKSRSTPLSSAPSTPAAESEPPTTPVPETLSAREKRKVRVRRKRESKAYSLDSQNDILGIVLLEVDKAEDLPRLKNMTRTGWDMDPFIVVSFGKKVFRTRVVRHSLNPKFEEKLLFHVRRYETSYSVQLAVHDWDKLSSNDHIGDTKFEVRELIEKAPQKNSETGLYDREESGEHDMLEYKLKLDGAKEASSIWESKHNPYIYVRAKYQPYDLLRQRFWRQYLKQYDTDDTGTISHIELTSMLDSLGSTLTRETVNAFFTSRGKQPHSDDLTIEEAIQSLEIELGRPANEKRRVDDDGGVDTSVSQTPAGLAPDAKDKPLNLSEMDFTGPAHVKGETYTTQAAEVPLEIAAAVPGATLAAAETPGGYSSTSYSSDDADQDEIPDHPASGEVVADQNASSGTKGKRIRFRKRGKATKTKEPSGSSSGSGSGPDDAIERVINVKNCPLCHRPRLNDKAEVDIVTHLAVCASQDWNRVNKIVVGNFVTASQAQRKWYTKIITKVSSGDYRLGANSANIIVQNRVTGQLEEEKMQVYVRLGIRLLYKGVTSRMEGGRARRLLKSMSIKQGLKYDSPHSALDIPAFIEFHGLDIDEILEPLDSFKTFNEFFYRKLKPSARPVEKPDDPYRLVSSADCRLMAFSTVNDATRLWIKGREFTVPRLLGDMYKDQAGRYADGSLVIFRLAPQDYHRFHSPVDGTIGPMSLISGEYYTVNPQAIRSSLDVYCENVRKVVPIDSPQFGRVMAVCVGAMMVGSIKTTVQEGEQIRRGDEFGYFAFGGSTIVMLFEKDAVEWDEDLLINSSASLETLVRVGMGIGIGRRPIAE